MFIKGDIGFMDGVFARDRVFIEQTINDFLLLYGL